MTYHSQDYLFLWFTIRSWERKFHRLFVPWTFHSLELCSPESSHLQAMNYDQVTKVLSNLRDVQISTQIILSTFSHTGLSMI